MQTLVLIFLLAVAIQVVYLIVLMVSIAKKRFNPTVSVHPVSVIVCAHDEEQNLRELIPALLKQNHTAFEVIIINDRSNDGTYDLLLEETKKDVRLKMVDVKQTPDHVNGKKFGITLGIKAAKYDWVLLTDADCRPDSNEWLRVMSEQFTDDKNFVLGYSAYEKRPGFLNLFIRFETLFTAIQYIGYALAGNPYMGVGRNLAYRKSVFLNNKGFGSFLPVTGGDDDLFVNRHATAKTTAVALGADALVHSFPKTTLADFYHQKVRHLAVGKKYRAKHQFLLAVFFFTHLVTWFVGIPLLFFSTTVIWAASALIFRTLLLSITVHQSAERFGQKFESWAVPLLDFLFVIYYISTAPVAFLTKKIRWKS